MNSMHTRTDTGAHILTLPHTNMHLPQGWECQDTLPGLDEAAGCGFGRSGTVYPDNAFASPCLLVTGWRDCEKWHKHTHTHTVGRISWVPVKLRGLSSSFIANGLGWPFWAWTHPSIPRLCASLVLSLTCSLPHHLSRTNTHTHTHTLYTFFSSSGHFCIVR